MPLPLIAATLIPMIPNIIGLVEGLVKKEKSGAEKMDLAVQFARTALNKLDAINGKGEQPTDDELRGMIQAIFTAQPPQPTPAGPKKMYLVIGSITEIKEA